LAAAAFPIPSIPRSEDFLELLDKTLAFAFAAVDVFISTRDNHFTQKKLGLKTRVKI
jgi:hypothetical protein